MYKYDGIEPVFGYVKISLTQQSIKEQPKMIKTMLFIFMIIELAFGDEICEKETYSIDLYTKSSNKDVDGKGIWNIHEGAGINYMFLGNESTTMTYNTTSGYISQPLTEQYKEHFSVQGSVAMMGVLQPMPVCIYDGNFFFNGTTEGFYACMNTGDPYRYSTASYQLMYSHEGKPYNNDNCTQVTLVVKEH